MQRLKSLNEIYQKRLIRPEYAHHQATPYGIALDPTLFNTDGSIRVPLAADAPATYPLTRSADAYTLNTSLVPGTVLVKTTGENVAIATGANTAERAFGLLANWVGGDFDEIGPQNVGSGVVGAWRGQDSTYTLLAPAYNDNAGGNNTLSFALSNTTVGQPILLYAGPDGRLQYYQTPANRVAVARLLDRIGTARIVIDLIV